MGILNITPDSFYKNSRCIDLSVIKNRIKSIIVSQLGAEESAVSPQSKFIEDLGADSLDIVELVMAIEEAFNIDIPDEEAENISKFPFGPENNVIKN